MYTDCIYKKITFNINLYTPLLLENKKKVPLVRAVSKYAAFPGDTLAAVCS